LHTSTNILDQFIHLNAALFFAGFVIAGPQNSFAAAASDQVIEVSAEIHRLRNGSRSRIVQLRNDQAIEVFLYADHETVEILRGSYCGGDEGKKEYTGNYKPASVLNKTSISSVLNVGVRVFTEDRIDGIEELPVVGRNERLIALYQYKGCNGNQLELYRVDDSGRLNNVLIHHQDGSKRAALGTGPGGEGRASGSEFSFCSYNNASGATSCDSYTYDGANFIQTASLLYQGLNEERAILEARRVLFEFLQNLNDGKYETAAFYYAGSGEANKRSNSAVSPKDHPKFLERYSTITGGACFKPERLDFKSTGSSDELRFSVSFVTGDWKPIVVLEESRFEFRVKRFGRDFKDP
jgi:hypothetical protein